MGFLRLAVFEKPGRRRRVVHTRRPARPEASIFGLGVETNKRDELYEELEMS